MMRSYISRTIHFEETCDGQLLCCSVARMWSRALFWTWITAAWTLVDLTWTQFTIRTALAAEALSIG